jgi:hypothetical protein
MRFKRPIPVKAMPHTTSSGEKSASKSARDEAGIITAFPARSPFLSATSRNYKHCSAASNYPISTDPNLISTFNIRTIRGCGDGHFLYSFTVLVCSYSVNQTKTNSKYILLTEIQFGHWQLSRGRRDRFRGALRTYYQPSRRNQRPLLAPSPTSALAGASCPDDSIPLGVVFRTHGEF